MENFINAEIITRFSEKKFDKITQSDLEDATKSLSAMIDEISSLSTWEEKIAKLSETYGFLKNTLIHLAAKAGDGLSTARILDILSENPEEMKNVVNARNDIMFSAMHFAAHSGNPDVVEALLAGGAENNLPASIENRQWTPIHYAAKFGYIDIIRILLNSGVDKETKTGFGLTPLIIAAEFNQLEAVKLLIEIGANKNAQANENNYKMNALHHAAVGNFCDIATMLLEVGIKTDQKTDLGLNALDLAAQSGKQEMVTLLLSWGVGDMENALEIAKNNGNPSCAEKIKEYVKIKKDFFNKSWLEAFESKLSDALKNLQPNNVSSINFSPSVTAPLNIYGLLALKDRVGFIIKKEKSLMQFCSDEGLGEVLGLLASARKVVGV